MIDTWTLQQDCEQDEWNRSIINEVGEQAGQPQRKSRLSTDTPRTGRQHHEQPRKMENSAGDAMAERFKARSSAKSRSTRSLSDIMGG